MSPKKKGSACMSYPKPDDRGMSEELVATRSPAIAARVAGLLGSIPTGIMISFALQPNMGNGHVMALALLATVPFLLALVPADPQRRSVALLWVTPLAFVSGVVSRIGPFMILISMATPFIIGLPLFLGIAAIASSHFRVKDGSLALAILGLSPAASCLAVYLADYVIAQLLGLPVGRTGADPRPIMVFGVAVAVSALATLAVALWMLQRRPAVPSKPATNQKWDEFDRD
jgi:hypothetical protein